jgi:hypothetical protein
MPINIPVVASPSGAKSTVTLPDPVVSPGATSPPQFGSAGAILPQSASTTADIPIPPGISLNDVILARLWVAPGQVVTAPAGFVAAPNSPVLVTGTGQDFQLNVFWKRQTSATGAGETTGTYHFTIAAGVTARIGYAVRYTNVVTGGNPFDVTRGVGGNGGAQPIQTPDVAVSTTVANTLLVWTADAWNGGTSVPPTGFTERVDTVQTLGTGSETTLADKVQAAAGPTGAVRGTISGGGATSIAAWMGALKAAGTVSPPPAAPTITSISPNPAPAGSVTINGSGFAAGATVSFGGAAATGVTVVSATQITCTAPAHADGSVNVTVTTSAGTSLAATFTYQASQPPPTNGPAPAYWSKWTKGPSTSDTWFPIGAYAGAVTRNTGVIAPYADLGAAFVAAGINLICGTDTWAHNDPAYLERVNALGLKAFVTATNPYGPLSGRQPDVAYLSAHPSVASCVIGWAMGDEFDLGPQHSVAGDQYGPNNVHAWYLANKNIDTTRPLHLNWGPWLPGNACAVGNGFWPYPDPATRLETGSAAGDYTLWTSSADISSYDFYFWSTDWSSMVGAWGYGAYVDGLRHWSRATDVTRPVWGMVEAGSSQHARPELPPLSGYMIESAIWSSIVHGARGIVYFINTLGDMDSAGPWGTGYWSRTVGDELIATMTRCHARILGLAPVLNSPETGVFDTYGRELCNSFVTVSSTNGVPIHLMYRQYGGKKYIFAQASGTEALQLSGNTTGTFQLVAGASGTVTVRDENRTVTATNGIWTDTFTPYQMHIYVI